MTSHDLLLSLNERKLFKDRLTLFQSLRIDFLFRAILRKINVLVLNKIEFSYIEVSIDEN